jgi:ubiquinone/menaquinone biosynthesis C-methylase UbiE
LKKPNDTPHDVKRRDVSDGPHSPHPAGRTYDRLAGAYDRAMRPLERWGLARLRAAALGRLPEGARLLEVGAGTGANFDYYPRAARAVASEPSGEMIVRARARRACADEMKAARVRLVRADAEELPFADDSFDAACASLVFCSVARPARAFAELRRVVRAGGRVVLLEHVRPAGVLGYVFDALSLLTVALFEDHFNRRTADEARRAGLSVLEVEKHLLGVVQIIVCRVE